ncbi:hypothetical protein H6S82_21485, partial [Planktothrix sp. FACHB-1355]|uniref:DNA sulfur modification protein DndB n=1 Tax=Planktothrix sp. FACHB-1355 TaxID=2692854 RepID=UPI0019A04167
DALPISEALVICLNQFFSECRDTRDIFETNVQELTVEEVAAFKENCILGWSVGLEILGRLLYCIYDKENNYFIDEKTSEIAQLDWAKKSHLWNGNVVLYNPNSENKNKSYKITANASGIRIAVNTAKAHLGWI